MSALLIGHALRARMGTQSRKLVLVKLVDAAEDDGTSIYPSLEKIAIAAECSVRQVQRVLAEFWKAGLIEKVKDGGKGPGSTVEWSMSVEKLFEIERGGWAKFAGVPDEESKVDIKSDEASSMTLATEKLDSRSPQTPPDPSHPERECAREVGEEGDPSAAEVLLALRKDWPDFALESQERSLLALSRLSPAERQTAVERVPDFLVFHREKRGKARLPYLHNYLAEKRWEGVPQQVKAVPKAEDGAVVKAFSRVWWWCFVRYVEAHGEALRDTTSGRAGWLRMQVSKSLRYAGNWPIDPAKHADIEEQAANRLTKYPKDGEHAQRWKAHYQSAFNVAMPLPDQAEWVWLPPELPSTGPPIASSVETVERDMATEGVG